MKLPRFEPEKIKVREGPPPEKPGLVQRLITKFKSVKYALVKDNNG